MTIERCLGGYFKWIVVDEGLTIVDPMWKREYETSVLCADNLCCV